MPAFTCLKSTCSGAGSGPSGTPTFLDLGQALRDVYEQGFYQKSVNYGELPPPLAFSEAELRWMRELGRLTG